jgi:PST family polysaccharide transporter
MLITSLSNVLGFLLVVRWGIVAVATSFVVVNYVLSPLAIIAVRRLIQISFKTYFSQFLAPLTGSLVMIGVMFGLKFILSDQLDLYVRLSIYTITGVLTYIAVILFTARETSQQVLELIRLALPKMKLKKV